MLGIKFILFKSRPDGLLEGGHFFFFPNWSLVKAKFKKQGPYGGPRVWCSPLLRSSLIFSWYIALIIHIHKSLHTFFADFWPIVGLF